MTNVNKLMLSVSLIALTMSAGDVVSAGIKHFDDGNFMLKLIKGSEIRVFDIQGKLLCQGVDALIVSKLGSGVYVAIANGDIRKFIIK